MQLQRISQAGISKKAGLCFDVQQIYGLQQSGAQHAVCSAGQLPDGRSNCLKDNSWMHEAQRCSLLEDVEDPETAMQRCCEHVAFANSCVCLGPQQSHVHVLQEQGLLCWCSPQLTGLPLKQCLRGSRR